MAISKKSSAYKKHGNGNLANHGSNWIRPKKRKAIYIRDDLKCVYCSASIEETTLTLDHLLPQELGGNNSASNLVTACKSCNSAKGNKSFKQFIIYLRHKGVNTKKISSRVRRNTKRKLKGVNYNL